jgi:hypothetical protein
VERWRLFFNRRRGRCVARAGRPAAKPPTDVAADEIGLRQQFTDAALKRQAAARRPVGGPPRPKWGRGGPNHRPEAELPRQAQISTDDVDVPIIEEVG